MVQEVDVKLQSVGRWDVYCQVGAGRVLPGGCWATQPRFVAAQGLQGQSDDAPECQDARRRDESSCLSWQQHISCG